MSLVAIRREVDADNSCLFSSMAYLLDRMNYGDFSANNFRQIIVEYLLSNKFDSTLLDLPKNEYIEFIINPMNWGGALEIKMFSEIFEKQICSIDVKTKRVDIYGQDKNYPETIYLLYNGIHYDPLVMNTDYSSDSNCDITIFDSNDSYVFDSMKELVGKCNDYHDFNSLQCEICNLKIVNQNEAYEHSIVTQHWNYKQI